MTLAHICSTNIQNPVNPTMVTRLLLTILLLIAQAFAQAPNNPELPAPALPDVNNVPINGGGGTGDDVFETTWVPGTDTTGTEETVWITGTPPPPTQFPTTPAPPMIPGCERLLTFDTINYPDGNEPTCFCDEELVGTMTISCLTGSNLTTLTDTLNLLRNSGWTKPVEQIYTNNMLVQDKRIPKAFFSGLVVKSIFLENCQGVFYMDDGALETLEWTLLSVTINKCYFGNPRFPLIFKGHLVLQEIDLHRTGIENEIQSNTFENLPALESLILTRNHITALDPSAFKSVPNLKFLNLNRNRLNQSVWPVLNQLTQLKNLTVGANAIEDIPKGAISNLKNLALLDVSDNEVLNLRSGALEGLQELTFLRLQVSGINFTDPDCLQGLPKLETLLLDGNYLREANLDILYNLPSLRLLGLRDNNFETIPPDSFAQLPQLTNLEVGQNAELLYLQPGSFRGLDNLQYLSLDGMGMKNLNRSIIAQVLPALKEFDYSGHYLDRLPKLFFQGATQLETVQLYRGGFQTLLHPTSFTILPKLKFLDISENPYFCDDKMIPVVEWIQKTATDFEENKTAFQFVDLDVTYCEGPPKHALTKLLYLNTTEMTSREIRNLTSSEEVREFFGFTDPPKTTEFQPGVGIPLSELIGVKSTTKEVPITTIIIGTGVSMLAITAVVLGVVSMLRIKKRRQLIENGFITPKGGAFS